MDGQIESLWNNILDNKDTILQNQDLCNVLLENDNKVIMDIINNNNMPLDAETYVLVAFMINMLLVFSMMVVTVNKN